MIKYLKFLLLLVVVLIAVAYVFIRQHPYSFAFAWVLNFALMMAVFFFTNIFKPQLAGEYYNLKKWEANGTIYKWFGVNGFRKFLVLTGWEKVIRAANPVKNDLAALKNLEHGTRQSEFGHLIVFFIVLGMNIFVAFRYGISKSLSLFILNIIFNFYPVILQRYNRPRLQRMIKICEAGR